MTSPPAVVGDLVVVGSAIGDNQRMDAPSGVVRALRRAHGRAALGAATSRPRAFVRTRRTRARAGYALGTPNAWAPFAVDAARDLVFVPTGNPMLDY